MAKIFISYKHKDQGVYPLEDKYGDKTARSYVNKLVEKLEDNNDIYKGEDDNEDISKLSDDRIAELLNTKIYDSTVTIVLVSKNMREEKPDKDQWIPREISYSLSENTRGGITSHTNAVLAVIIPDENNRYDYFIRENDCCTRWPTCTTFEILRNNMFNLNNPETHDCDHGKTHNHERPSYIDKVKWSDFIDNDNVDSYINRVLEIKENFSDYDVQKVVTKGN